MRIELDVYELGALRDQLNRLGQTDTPPAATERVFIEADGTAAATRTVLKERIETLEEQLKAANAVIDAAGVTALEMAKYAHSGPLGLEDMKTHIGLVATVLGVRDEVPW